MWQKGWRGGVLQLALASLGGQVYYEGDEGCADRYVPVRHANRGVCLVWFVFLYGDIFVVVSSDADVCPSGAELGGQDP